jgi:fructokinase
MVYTLGESLLDIIFSENGNIAAKAGGSMLNTAVSLGRSGIEVSMISETGDDETAKIILNFLEDNKVQTKFIKKYYHQTTSVALAFLDNEKKPTFSIHKSYPNNRLLPSPINFDEVDVMAFGSMYSIELAIRHDLVHIISRAKNSGSILIFDPNIRSHKIDEGPLRDAMLENIAFANIVKASDEDLLNIFGKRSYEDYFSEIKAINPEAIFVITLGKNGVVAFFNETSISLPANEVELVSTIGAGDAFTAGMIYFLKKSKISGELLSEMNKNTLEKMLESGNRFASEVCGSMENYVLGY